MSENKSQEQIEAEDVWTRDQKHGGVGEEIKPLEEPEEASKDEFVGFNADEVDDVND